MKFIKADGIPLPVTIFAIIMGIGALVIGIQALLDPTTALDFVDGADKMGIAWGGRNAGLGVVMAAAVILRNANVYVAGFAAAIFREGSDLIAGLSEGGTFDSAVTTIAVLLVIDVAALAFSIMGLRKVRSAAAAS